MDIAKRLNRQCTKNISGFTLIELLIVVAILGILGAIAIPIYNGYISVSKQKSAESVIEQIPVLLETFRAERGSFPANGVYDYTETDAGEKSDNIGETGVGKAGLTGFKPRSESYPATQGVLYHFRLTIVNSGTVNETATYFASPQTGRGAPTGNIPNPAATYN